MTARQTAVKAIHEDKLDVRNPSILAKLLENYANEGCKCNPDIYTATRKWICDNCGKIFKP